MIKLNVVARIAADKNSFPDLIFALHELNKQGITQVHFVFIGSIYSMAVYENIIEEATRLHVLPNIAFTKRSIPISELSEEVQQGYFINFTIGNFVGYSALESIKNGYKTILYNADPSLEGESSGLINSCANLNELIGLIKKIDNNKTAVDTEIMAANQKMINRFCLDVSEKDNLLSMMLPGKEYDNPRL